jgi:hypothetical protein
MPVNELIDSTNDLGDRATLRSRSEEDGYLFFRSLLPAEDILLMRSELLSVVRAHGFLKYTDDPLSGELDLVTLNRIPADKMRLDIGVPAAVYHDVQKLRYTHGLPHHPRLRKLFETLFGADVFVHPRHIVRMVTPHRDMVPTPIHQDFPLIQGTPNTWTCWFPIGECTKSLGGLAVLRASHRKGYLPIDIAEGAGGITAQLCPDEDQWLTTDYRVGDVLIFPSYTVHKAMPCQSKGRIRLSFDVRYQPAGEPIEAKSLLPHCDLTWDEIYASWPDDDELKYYWRNLAQPISPWDESLVQPGRRIC